MSIPCPFITVNLTGQGTPPLRLNVRYIVAWQELLGQGSAKTRISVTSGTANLFFDVLQSEPQITALIQQHNQQV